MKSTFKFIVTAAFLALASSACSSKPQVSPTSESTPAPMQSIIKLTAKAEAVEKQIQQKMMSLSFDDHRVIEVGDSAEFEHTGVPMEDETGAILGHVTSRSTVNVTQREGSDAFRIERSSPKYIEIETRDDQGNVSKEFRQETDLKTETLTRDFFENRRAEMFSIEAALRSGQKALDQYGANLIVDLLEQKEVRLDRGKKGELVRFSVKGEMQMNQQAVEIDTVLSAIVSMEVSYVGNPVATKIENSKLGADDAPAQVMKLIKLNGESFKLPGGLID